MDVSIVVGTAIGSAFGLGTPLTVAVFKLIPSVMNKNGNSREFSDHFETRMRETMASVVEDKLAPLLTRQTDILERMAKQQERMEQTLGDNTMALQVFMKVEEQRMKGAI